MEAQQQTVLGHHPSAYIWDKQICCLFDIRLSTTCLDTTMDLIWLFGLGGEAATPVT
jgi:hypothetical protein